MVDRPAKDLLLNHKVSLFKADPSDWTERVSFPACNMVACYHLVIIVTVIVLLWRKAGSPKAKMLCFSNQTAQVYPGQSKSLEGGREMGAADRKLLLSLRDVSINYPKIHGVQELKRASNQSGFSQRWKYL